MSEASSAVAGPRPTAPTSISPHTDTPMDVRFTDEQNLLRDSARDFLASHCPMALVRGRLEADADADPELWRRIAALGWTGLTIAEALGGSGLGTVDLCVLLEETGAALLPAPLFSTVAVGSACIARADDDQRRQALLPQIADGRLRVSLAQLERSGGWSDDDIRMVAEPAHGGFRLAGDKLFVYDGHSADLLIVPARSAESDRIVLLLVEPSSPGVSVETTAYTDLTRKTARVRLAEVRVEKDALLVGAERGAAVLGEVHDAAKVALCAEMLGGARTVLARSVEYAKTRQQFGSAIGRFQAIQHKCANMLVLLESARSATYYAAWALDNREPDAHVAACMAKAYVGEAFSRIAADGIQIHGGMGFTWEADLHLYYKRAKADELMFGTAAFNRELAARQLIDGRT